MDRPPKPSRAPPAHHRDTRPQDTLTPGHQDLHPQPRHLLLQLPQRVGGRTPTVQALGDRRGRSGTSGRPPRRPPPSQASLWDLLSLRSSRSLSRFQESSESVGVRAQGWGDEAEGQRAWASPSRGPGPLPPAQPAPGPAPSLTLRFHLLLLSLEFLHVLQQLSSWFRGGAQWPSSPQVSPSLPVPTLLPASSSGFSGRPAQSPGVACVTLGAAMACAVAPKPPSHHPSSHPEGAHPGTSGPSGLSGICAGPWKLERLGHGREEASSGPTKPGP